jgi:hypothetical protein
MWRVRTAACDDAAINPDVGPATCVVPPHDEKRRRNSNRDHQAHTDLQRFIDCEHALHCARVSLIAARESDRAAAGEDVAGGESR